MLAPLRHTHERVVGGGGGGVGAHVMSILVMLAEAIVPDPFETVQLSPLGCVLTVTEYAVPDGKAVGIVKEVAPAAAAKVSALFARTRPLEVSPLMLPPTLYVFVVHVT